MRRSAVFLTVALTAFIMSTLAGILHAYNGLTLSEPFSPVQVGSQDQALTQAAPGTDPVATPARCSHRCLY